MTGAFRGPLYAHCPEVSFHHGHQFSCAASQAVQRVIILNDIGPLSLPHLLNAQKLANALRTKMTYAHENRGRLATMGSYSNQPSDLTGTDLFSGFIFNTKHMRRVALSVRAPHVWSRLIN